MNLHLNYQFQNQKLLTTALTHRSYLNEHRGENLVSNERLEFLGDAVLELALSLFLFEKYPSFPEGRLTFLRTKLVQTKTLAMAAEKLKLGDQLRLSKGEKESGGQNNPSLLADTFEAVIGAVYCDSNFDQAYKFIQTNLLIPAEKAFADKLPEDYKSRLQEKVQAQGLAAPAYQVLKSSGPDHNKTFQVAVLINGQAAASGQGASKQKAEQRAAQKALKKFANKKQK